MNKEAYEDVIKAIKESAIYGDKLKNIRHEYDPRLKVPHMVFISVTSPSEPNGITKWADGHTAVLAAKSALQKLIK